MVRPWYRSRWFRIGGGLLLLGLIVAALIPFLVPVDRFRPLLARLIENATGRQVEIGALRLHLFPAVSVRAVNVRVKNPAGLPPGDTVTVRSIDIGVETRALLSRRLDVTSIAVNGVRLTLLREPGGKTNYDLRTPQGPPESTGFLVLDRIGAVTIKNVEVVYSTYDARRRQARPSFTVTGLSARITDIHPNAQNWLKQLTLTSDLNGVRFSTPALSKPLQVQKGEFLVKGGTGRGSLSMVLEKMRGEGSVTVASLAPLAVKFSVTIPELDIAALDKMTVSTPGGGPEAPAPHDLLARGAVKVERIAFAPFAADRFVGQVSVYTNTIELDSYSLAVYGGTVRGKAALNYDAPSMPAFATAQVRGVDLGRIVKTAAPGARRITGTLEADVRGVTAFGRDPKVALTGGGTFAIRNGVFQGLDLQSSLAQITKTLQLNVPAGDTRFTYFGGDLRIANQRAYSDALRLEADTMEGTARGSAGFNRTLDYAGTGVLKRVTTSQGSAWVGQLLGNAAQGTASGLGVRIPFSLKGTVDDPKFSLAGTPQPVQGQGKPPSTNLLDLFKPKN